MLTDTAGGWNTDNEPSSSVSAASSTRSSPGIVIMIGGTTGGGQDAFFVPVASWLSTATPESTADAADEGRDGIDVVITAPDDHVLDGCKLSSVTAILL
jgi:hypothetical protein